MLVLSVSSFAKNIFKNFLAGYCFKYLHCKFVPRTNDLNAVAYYTAILLSFSHGIFFFHELQYAIVRHLRAIAKYW